ncbi:hypothetical protein Zmor_008706 [Zophobas morio]|jgi:hypothetical protein|uniref:Uncharacterized protein n=1 Tax=Zophobas morio TaxID=2755281 RepID=A0AA38HIN2_9CUCU|nr:hypothetical protein Zmor_008706 [Zophobas morio]
MARKPGIKDVLEGRMEWWSDQLPVLHEMGDEKEEINNILPSLGELEQIHRNCSSRRPHTMPLETLAKLNGAFVEFERSVTEANSKATTTRETLLKN